jgi:hypothetical protein
MNEIVLQQPDEGELKGKGAQLVDQANELEITTADEYEHAGEWLVAIKGVGKQLLERFSDPCSKALAAWKSMTAMRDEAMKPFTSAEIIVKRKMAAFQFAIDEARRKDEEKKAAKAREDAEKLRRKQSEEARKLGDKEAVQNLKEAPLEVQAQPSLIPAAPKVSGVSYRKVWKVQSVNIGALPSRYLMPDMKAIEGVVRSLGAKHGISGVTVVEETVTSVRGL